MKIVFLAGNGESTRFMYNALKNDFLIDKVIIEKKASPQKMIKRRIKKLGFLHVVNQIFFQLTIQKILKVTSKSRIKYLKSKFHLSNKAIPEDVLHNVSSVNDEECIETIKRINPDVIIVNGTRIISNKVLKSVDAIFVNTHIGVTPQYRGVHGAYWALVNNDEKNCGVTIHLVDPGIDTGSILKQEIIHPSSKDNFITYTYHQYGAAVLMMKSVLKDIIKGEFKTYDKENVKSKLYYHPTMTFYMYNLIMNKVR